MVMKEPRSTMRSSYHPTGGAFPCRWVRRESVGRRRDGTAPGPSPEPDKASATIHLLRWYSRQHSRGSSHKALSENREPPHSRLIRAVAIRAHSLRSHRRLNESNLRNPPPLPSRDAHIGDHRSPELLPAEEWMTELVSYIYNFGTVHGTVQVTFPIQFSVQLR